MVRECWWYVFSRYPSKSHWHQVTLFWSASRSHPCWEFPASSLQRPLGWCIQCQGKPTSMVATGAASGGRKRSLTTIAAQGALGMGPPKHEVSTHTLPLQYTSANLQSIQSVINTNNIWNHQPDQQPVIISTLPNLCIFQATRPKTRSYKGREGLCPIEIASTYQRKDSPIIFWMILQGDFCGQQTRIDC